MDWVSIKDRLPEFGQEVLVKVKDLSFLMMGLELFTPTGEYKSIYRKDKSWSNAAGYYASYWKEI